MKTMLAGILGLALTASAQTFDVVSVKSSGPDTRGTSIQTNRGTLIARGTTVGFLLQYAYKLKPPQITGGPNWLDNDRFEIQAKTDGDANKTNDDKIFLMIQALLEDRFKLKFHREMRELPVFVLTVAKGGPKLKPEDTSPGPTVRSVGGGAGAGSHSTTARSMTMANLAAQATQTMGRIVVDETGLTGNYAFTLQWSDEAADPATAAPTIFTALQEQLGLKLESARRLVEVFVIDSAEKPAEN